MNEASQTAMRQRILIGIALLILGIYAVFSVIDARAASDRLALAHQDLGEIKQKLNEITLLSEAPTVAAIETESAGAINARIDSALAKTGTAKIRSVPGQAVQITGTQYKSRKTEILLVETTLRKIVEFCDALREEDNGSVITRMQLTVPRNGGGNARQENWKATLTLTQTIYSPKSE